VPGPDHPCTCNELGISRILGNALSQLNLTVCLFDVTLVIENPLKIGAGKYLTARNLMSGAGCSGLLIHRLRLLRLSQQQVP
jgi:hypothetical protein